MSSSSVQGEVVDGKLKYVKGDLFSCPATDALAHCISEDCRMVAGFAVLFKKKYGGVDQVLAQSERHDKSVVAVTFTLTRVAKCGQITIA